MEAYKIKVHIADRTYTLTVDSTQEESVRKSALELNDHIKEMQKRGVKDNQDALALTALNLSAELRKNDKTDNTLSPEYLNLISEIYTDLDKMLS